MLSILGGVASLFGNSKVVYYIRDQVSAIESRFNQAIKSRICLSELSVKKFIDNNPTLDYSLFHGALHSFFPHSKIEPVLYDRSQMKSNDVREDFFIRCGIFNHVKKGKDESNEKIKSATSLALCYVVNSSSMSIDDKMDLKKYAIKFFNGEVSGNTINDSDANYIYEHYKKTNFHFFSNLMLEINNDYFKPSEKRNCFLQLVNNESLVPALLKKIKEIG